jgi:hypothetical protein
MRQAVHLYSKPDGVTLSAIKGQRATRIYLTDAQAKHLAERLLAHATGLCRMEMVVEIDDEQEG